MFQKKDRDSTIGVKRSAAIPPLRPEFDKFLYAPVGQNNDDDSSFSVLSALARQNLDPWEEAAKLAQLPRESATERLASLIDSGARGPSAPAAPAIAARLVALLPRSEKFNIASFHKSPDQSPRNYTPVILGLIIGALILASVVLGN